MRVSRDLPGDGTYLRVAQHVGHTLLEDTGALDRDIADIEFIVGEPCTNVVRYAQALKNGRPNRAPALRSPGHGGDCRTGEAEQLDQSQGVLFLLAAICNPASQYD